MKIEDVRKFFNIPPLKNLMMQENSRAYLEYICKNSVPGKTVEEFINEERLSLSVI